MHRLRVVDAILGRLRRVGKGIPGAAESGSTLCQPWRAADRFMSPGPERDSV